MLYSFDRARDDFVVSMKGVQNLLLRETSATKHLYVGELLGGTSFSPKMVSLLPLGCFDIHQPPNLM